MPLHEYKNGERSRGDRSFRKSGLRVPVILSVVLVVLVSLLVFLYVKGEALDIPTDPLSLCPLNEPPAEIVVVLLDISDQFSEPQLIAVTQQMRRIRSALPQSGLIDVYAVSREGERLPRSVGRLCNPGTGEDLNRLYQNPALAHRKWESFIEKFDRTIEEIGQLPHTQTSPIFESVQAVALRTLNDPEFDGVPKRLVIVSDLIQHVPGKQSHYQTVPIFQEFRGNPYFSQTRPNLTDTSVDVLYLRRSELKMQGVQHVTFWTEFLEFSGAQKVAFTSVYGDK